MYSKYLDYTDVAVKAHNAAIVENDQKDILISSLKNELFHLRQLQADFLQLNDLILALQDKYSLLLDDKSRCQKEQRIKTDIDKNGMIDLKEEIDGLRVQMQRASFEIDELIRDNTGMKKMSDTRGGQIQNMKYQIKGAQNKNDRAHQQNKDIALTIKGLKEQRKILQQQCDKLDGILDANIGKLKGLQKQVRNSESTNARLGKTLHQAENDNGKLMGELKVKTEQAKRAQFKLNGMNNNVQEMKISYNNLLQQAQRNKNDSANNANNLNIEVGKGKELNHALNSVNATIRAQESQLDAIITEEERLRKEHYLGLDNNKQLNSQIDKMLALICEYEQVNKELIDELQIYIDQDEQARAILNRKDAMRQIIQSTLRKIAVSGQPIKHLKY